jgi:GNAT superfamily N-acetyltransferase
MEQLPADTPRVATVAEVANVAELLDAFNREYHTPTPGKAVLATRLERLLASGEVVALLTGDPAVAVALLTLRPNVWYDGPVALLDELYVAPEMRGRGLGSALLAAAEALTRQRGGELLEIMVDGDDTGARRFYERHGYVNSELGEDRPSLYYFREVGNATS